MGFKMFSLGRQAPAAGAAEMAADAATAPSTRSTPAETLSGRLSRIPFASQQRALTAGVVLSLAALLASVYFDNREANNGAAQIEIAGDMLMHSQRLAKAVPVALLGNAQAFTQLRQSKSELAGDLQALQDGSDAKHVRATGAAAAPLLEKAMESWQRTEKSAGDVLAQQPTLTTIGQTLQIFSASNPELLESAEQAAAITLQSGANASEVAASAQPVMVTQRRATNPN